jgi:aldehyde:ferredoxin oxidoreductase
MKPRDLTLLDDSPIKGGRAFDAAGLCHLTFLFKNPETIMPMIDAFYGVNLTLTDFMQMGKEMLRQERPSTSKRGSVPVQTGSPIG